MGLIKCIVCPNRGNFESGKYYGWWYEVDNQYTKVRNLHIRDTSGENINFSVKEVNRYFRDIKCSNIDVEIYIDRKKELIFVPAFTHEIGYKTVLEYYDRLSPPYTEKDIGVMFQKVWEEHKNHAVVSERESELSTPFYKIVMKGKGWRSFTSGRWLISAEFILSENEIIFNYQHKKNGNSYGSDIYDRKIERIVTMSASDIEIGSTIIGIFQEAKII